VCRYYGDNHVFTAFHNSCANKSRLFLGVGAITHPCNHPPTDPSAPDLHCSLFALPTVCRYYGDNHFFTAFNNTWANNSALIRGGGAITHPCNLTIHSDSFLGNHAAQEGGGFMVYGGTAVLLQNVRVSCNTAQNGGGLMVRLSDSSDDSQLDMRCSQVTANGGLPESKALQACLDVFAESPSSNAAEQPSILLAAAAAGGSSADTAAADSLPGNAAALAVAEKGGGLYIAADQKALVSGSFISGNRASSSGAGVYLDRSAVLTLRGAAAAGAAAGSVRAVGSAAGAAGGVVASAVSWNNCTGGSGGGAFMDESSEVDAADTTWSNNQVGSRT
jgi:hypothetical protein